MREGAKTEGEEVRELGTGPLREVGRELGKNGEGS
jgi:hypothetical protein